MLEKTIHQANLNYLINKIERIKDKIIKLDYDEIYKVGTKIGYYGLIAGLATKISGLTVKVITDNSMLSDISTYVIVGSVILGITSIEKRLDRLDGIINRKLNKQSKLEQNLEN